MRISLIIAASCLGLGAISMATEAQAALKQPTNIAAQSLGSALQSLARDRNLQLIYATDEVESLHTSGAVGELSLDQALSRLLSGTGLTYSYLDEKTIAVQPLNPNGSSKQATTLSSDQSNTAHGTDSNNGRDSKEGSQKRSFWTLFRLAQADHRPSTLNPAQNSDATRQGRADAASATTNLEEIVVSGHYEFLSVDTSGATNLPLPIEKVPQSINLVSEDFIKAADVKTLGEIAEYTPGALNVGSPANSNTVIKIRGFTSDLAIDGVNLAAGGEYSGGYEPDWAIIDRLEIVKGPSSVIYGVGSTGGVVNLVTKSPTSTTPSYLSVQGGSWNSFRVEGQVSGSLGSNIRALGVAAQDQGDSFVDVVNHRTTVLYGAFNADYGNVTAYLHGGWEHTQRTTFDGIPTEPDGSPAPLPRSFFIGSDNMNLYTSVFHGEGGVIWHATDMLDLSLKTTVQQTHTHGVVAFGDSLQPSGDMSISATSLPINNLSNLGVAASGVYHFDSLGFRDSFASLQALYQDSDFDRAYGRALFNGSYAGTANIFDGEASISEAMNSAPFTPVVYALHEAASTLTFSGQSVFKFFDHWSALVGASYSKLNEKTNTFTADDAPLNYALTSAPVKYEFPGRMSYRGGLVYEFLPGTDAYISYSQSFEPQAYIGADNALLPPLEGEQYEAGVKYRTLDGHLLLTGAVFRTTQKNSAEYFGQVDGTDRYQAVGEVLHKGVELQAIGRLTPQWQVNIGYAYLDATITKDTNSANVGQTDAFLPKTTADIFTEYAFDTPLLHGLSVGGGIRHVGSERTSLQGLTKDIPAYTLVDLTSSYSFQKWSVRLNVHNVLNRRYYINNYQTLYYGNQVGEPANFSLTLRRTF